MRLALWGFNRHPASRTASLVDYQPVTLPIQCSPTGPPGPPAQPSDTAGIPRQVRLSPPWRRESPSPPSRWHLRPDLDPDDLGRHDVSMHPPRPAADPTAPDCLRRRQFRDHHQPARPAHRAGSRRRHRIGALAPRHRPFVFVLARRGGGQQLPAQRQLLPPVAIRQDPVVPDPYEARRQHVHHEPPDELDGTQCDDHHSQQQPQCVHQDVPLDPVDLLPHIVVIVRQRPPWA